VEVVARHLRDRALALSPQSGDDADLFGRSAFNRYYYSAYLTTKRLLQPAFSEMPDKHAAIPDFLRGTVSKELKRRKVRALRVEDHVATRLAQYGCRAALELADVLVRGYSARVAADYHPEVSVSFYEYGFKLNEVQLNDAESWPHRAMQLSTLIISAKRQTDGI
jgi:hypothetical protein